MTFPSFNFIFQVKRIFFRLITIDLRFPNFDTSLRTQVILSVFLPFDWVINCIFYELQVETSCLHLIQHPISFHAKGLFSINNTFLLTVRMFLQWSNNNTIQLIEKCSSFVFFSSQTQPLRIWLFFYNSWNLSNHWMRDLRHQISEVKDNRTFLRRLTNYIFASSF